MTDLSAFPITQRWPSRLFISASYAHPRCSCHVLIPGQSSLTETVARPQLSGWLLIASEADPESVPGSGRTAMLRPGFDGGPRDPARRVPALGTDRDSAVRP